MTVSNSGLAFVLLHMRKGKTIKEIAELVKSELMDERERELALEYLRNQYRIRKTK